MPRIAKKKLSPRIPSQKAWYYLRLLGIIVLLGLLLWRQKSLFVVALVNNQPVGRWELEERLLGSYGAQTLDEIINEHLIIQEGQKKGIVVSDKEVADKVAEIDKSLGGKISLSDALASQGLSLTEFQKQIRLQLTLEKLAAGSLVVTETEISDYIASNSATLTATDEAGLKIEARDALLMQKKNVVLRQLFADLKNRAKVVKFL